MFIKISTIFVYRYLRGGCVVFFFFCGTAIVGVRIGNYVRLPGGGGGNAAGGGLVVSVDIVWSFVLIEEI